MGSISRTRKFVELHREMEECRDCALCEQRSQVVPGAGAWDSEVMLIGEAPGATEDITGVPFVGQAGKLLDHLLSSAALKRENIYITNVVKCRPPRNRQPTKGEIAHCFKFLKRQIEYVNPRVIVLCGATSLGVFSKLAKVSEDHGEPFLYDGRICFPIFHPAAALRSRSLVPVIATDLRKIRKLLREGVPKGTREVIPVISYQQKFDIGD